MGQPAGMKTTELDSEISREELRQGANSAMEPEATENLPVNLLEDLPGKLISCSDHVKPLREESGKALQPPLKDGSEGNSAQLLLVEFVRCTQLPERVSAALGKLDANDPILTMSIRDAWECWPEVQERLLELKGVGEVTVSSLRRAVKCFLVSDKFGTGSCNRKQNTESEPEPITDQSYMICEILGYAHIPTRIRTLFQSMSPGDPLKTTTVEFAVANWATFSQDLLSRRGIGEGSVEELRSALEGFLSADARMKRKGTMMGPRTPSGETRRHDVHAFLGAGAGTTLGRVISGKIKSIDKEGCDIRATLDGLTIKDREQGATSLRLSPDAATMIRNLRTSNFDNRALEIAALACIASERETAAWLPDTICKWLLPGHFLKQKKPMESLFDGLTGADADQAEGKVSLALDFLAIELARRPNRDIPRLALIPRPLEDDANAVLGMVGDKAEHVLRLRTGVGGSGPSTLENCGRQLGVSRERIRQIENRARKTILRLLGRDFLRARLRVHHAELWYSFAMTEKNAPKALFSSCESGSLLPEQRFLISLVYGDVRDWLTETSESCCNGRVFAPDNSAARSLEELIRRMSRFRPARSSFSLMPSEDPFEGLNIRSLNLLADIVLPGSSVVQRPNGHYWCSDQAASTLLRIKIDESMDDFSRVFISEGEFWSRLAPNFDPPIQTTAFRRAASLMSKSGSGYVRIGNFGWIQEEKLIRGLAMGLAVETPILTGSALGPPEWCTPVGSAAHEVWKFLRENGGVSQRDLNQWYSRRAGNRKEENVGFLLTVLPHLILGAPGLLTALDEEGQLPRSTSWSRKLASLTDIGHFLMAAQAEFPLSLLPMFNSDTCEFWHEWLRSEKRVGLAEVVKLVSDRQISSSNRSICSPDDLLDLREPCQHALNVRIPSLESLVRVAAAGACFGGVSWCLVNRVVGNQFESHQAIPWLAVLLSTGMVYPKEHWQDFMPFRQEANSSLAALLEQRRGAGKIPIRWTAPGEGQRLLSSMRQFTEADEVPCWVNKTEMLALSRALHDGLADTRTIRQRTARRARQPVSDVLEKLDKKSPIMFIDRRLEALID